MPNPHDLALIVLTVGCALGALMMSDAADEAFRAIPAARRRRAALLTVSRVPVWTRPVALHCVSLGLLAGMATAGAILVGAFP